MKKIILCPNPNRDRGMETTRRADAILRQMGFQTVVCPPFKDQKDGAYGDYKTRPLTAELKSADLLITFGGDGTILHLAKLVALNKIPVLGINMGGLGFIAELEAGELEALRKLKDWDFQTEQRMMLDVTVQREGRQIYTNMGLNDAGIREGLLPVRRGAGGGAGGPDHGGLSHLHPQHALFVLCPLAGAHADHRAGAQRPQAGVSVRGREPGLLPEGRRQDPGPPVQAHRAAGAAVGAELL